MTDHGHLRSEYVLTHDLGTRIQMLRSVGLEVPAPDDPLILEIQGQLVEDLAAAVPDSVLTVMNMHDVAAELVGLARERWPDALIVSLCPEIAPEGSIQLEVSRLYNLRGNRLGIGPRPGHPSLIEQTQAMPAEARERGVVIVEDGAYSGETLAETVNAMKARRIFPVGVVANFTFDLAKPTLASLERGGIDVVLARDLTNPVAWHPDHEFFPFVPGYGRVVGFVMEGQHRTNRFPLYTYNGASYAFPYLRQFSNSDELWTRWSGLPVESAEFLGTKCMGSTIALFEEIERLNDRQICIGDVLATQIRTGIPLTVGQSDFPPLERRIIGYLNELT